MLSISSRPRLPALLLVSTIVLVVVLPARALAGKGLVGPAVAALVAEHGESERARIEKGVEQAATMWRDSDGDPAAFQAMASELFIVDPAFLDAAFGHLERSMEMVDGHFLSMAREMRHFLDVETGPILPIDRLLAEWDPSAHLDADMFDSRIAFAVLLNFPGSSLTERLEQGDQWSRRRWAEARLVDRFTTRIPARFLQDLNAATSRADAYVAAYNLHLHQWLSESGDRLFPEDLRLISHWGLRDELKSHYGQPGGLERQRMIGRVMEHIVRQSIPEQVIDDPSWDWRPFSGRLSQGGEDVVASREADRRYELLLDIFAAQRALDEWTPEAPNALRRAFDRDREIPVERVRGMFKGLFDTDAARRTARFIADRLDRDLEPFDIWYSGFEPRTQAEATLDETTKARYPGAEAFAADLPRILKELGFGESQVELLTSHIIVDPSRGAGHAMGAQRRDDSAHLRTRIGADGMDYKGYNIAVHELGHNVEQVFSLNLIDHTILNGVPASAFTEALAFVFQGRDLELLGLASDDPSRVHLHALETLWSTLEIGAVTLVDIAVWEWMYANPDATPAQLREATVKISEGVWADTFGRLMGGGDSALLGIYSHMLAYPLYLANYPLGHLIAFQLEEHFRGKDLAAEFERVCRLGRLTPDLWMLRAVGEPVGPDPLLRAADQALDALIALP